MKQQLEEFLKTHRDFKDCFPNDEAIERYERCRDKIFLTQLIPTIGNDCVTDKYAQGYVAGINAVLKVVKEYNTKAKEYGDMN